MRRQLISVLVLAAAACAAAGQSPVFLVPESAETGLASTVRLSAVRAPEARAEPQPWPGDRIGHFFARTAWTQENRDTLAHDEGSETVASWPADRPGVLLLGLDLKPALDRVEAAPFALFLEQSLGEDARAALGSLPAEGEVVVERTESAKTLVRVSGGEPEPDSIATSKTGQAVELRPLMDPTSLVPGSDLAVKVYSRLPGSARGIVTATNSTTGEVVRAVTSDESLANIRIEHAGRWRLEFHTVARVEAEGAPAPWAVHTATLTFDVVEEVGK